MSYQNFLRDYGACSPECLEKMVAAIAINAPFQLPLFRAVRDGKIKLVQPGRNASIPRRHLESDRPTCILIGDDDYHSCGPEGWAVARRLRYWGRGALIHAAGGRINDYEIAVAGTLDIKCFVLVETDTAHGLEWGDFLKKHMACLGIFTRPGDVHPVMTEARQ